MTSGEPDDTAVRVALWRALHLEVDASPPVFDDAIGLRLVAPDDDWRRRPDMDPDGTRGFRAAIVARARFVEDLVTREHARGVDQYVVLGAGLDTFAQRRADVVETLDVFEVEQPGTQAWKQQRLRELGYPGSDRVHFVPVDFEAGESWQGRLVGSGFDAGRPAVVASTGVAMYLSKETTAQTLRDVARFAPGSTLAMTFLLPPDLLDPADRAGLDTSRKGAHASGTPFVSFYTPDEMIGMARDAGFADVRHIAGTALGDRYFTDRPDGLRPSSGEDFVVART
ncbi:class I SAM-dependent methyltransferase [Rhodococcus sp. HNM0569]|uniref:class I SAM-dependent methyltransferase n=1 Tax=Rhodococcus sp. HNM0569 TaxID=2716340 RepID=UPI00146E8C65|nr:class I SAM-dependent methyltransferase [Rhodococcus sp. HNM0569]NLU84514.1 class I SAM-dependent methyltransferase [Rhodococcus sp. HNM0569]